MADIVLKLPIQPGAEAHAFGRYLYDFMERRTRRFTGRAAVSAAAPFMMVRADPAAGGEAKILIFQEDRLARVFSAGWERRRAETNAA